MENLFRFMYLSKNIFFLGLFFLLLSGKRGEKRISRIPASAQSKLSPRIRNSIRTSQSLFFNPITMDELLPEPGDLQVCVLSLHVVQAPVGVPH